MSEFYCERCSNSRTSQKYYRLRINAHHHCWSAKIRFTSSKKALSKSGEFMKDFRRRFQATQRREDIESSEKSNDGIYKKKKREKQSNHLSSTVRYSQERLADYRGLACGPNGSTFFLRNETQRPLTPQLPSGSRRYNFVLDSLYGSWFHWALTPTVPARRTASFAKLLFYPPRGPTLTSTRRRCAIAPSPTSSMSRY
ncbi:hypothetical protein KM043_012989 [Ampulex compressa]|nr:hypothetical protein KM043_012989 [Ampulex compressa]